MKNWEDEHNKHLNDDGLGLLCKLFGNHLKEYKTVKSNDVKEGFATLEIEKLFVFDWFLTTYETLRDYQTSFAEINFSCIIFDLDLITDNLSNTSTTISATEGGFVFKNNE